MQNILQKDYQPQNDWLLIAVHESAKETKGGIIIPEKSRDHQERSIKGDIMKAGTEVKDEDLSTGVTVSWIAGSEKQVVIEDKAFAMVREDDIIGIWE